MNWPKKATVVEVGPRDGFQNEHGVITTDEKVEIIDLLSGTGLSRIEATSFTHPKAIPQLADAGDVMSRIKRKEGVEYEALIPNLKGLDRAIEAKVDSVATVVSASETHNMNNVRMTIADSMKQFEQVVRIAHENSIRVTAGLACVFGCSFEGWVRPEKVVEIVDAFLAMGVDEVSLGDTVGLGDPSHVAAVLRQVREKTGDVPLRLHFHNSRGTGLANVYAGLEEGVTIFDSSIAGLGGCPFAPGATGNIATADLVNMLESMGVDTGVDLRKVIECEKRVREILGREMPSEVLKAGPTPWALAKPAA